MSKEIDQAVGINRGKDHSHVDALMAAGGFAPPNRVQGTPAPRGDDVSMARAAGVKGGGAAPTPPPASAPRIAPAAAAVRDIAAGALKPVKPLKEHDGQRKLRRSPVPPTPRVAWLNLDQLVIDDSYQRALSEQGTRLIRRMVEDWDWARFKPLSVAATEGGKYEIVDGQHSAIAAATHGSIDSLPCLVLPLATQAERARAFVGVNSERTSLKSYALYRGRLVGGDPMAGAVKAAVDAAGARLVETVSAGMSYAVGDVGCISTMLGLVKGDGGEARLTEALRICIAARLGPIPAQLLRALDPILAMGGGSEAAEALTGYILGLGWEKLAAEADKVAGKDKINRRIALQRLFLSVVEG